MLELFMNEMTFGSVCSGVECASIALLPLGWRCVFVSEVEPFPCAVLQQRFDATPPIHPLDPNEQGIKSQDRQERLSWLKIINKMPQIGTLPNEGDFRKIGKKYEGRIKCLIGGTPCQSFSVAGKREGLAGVSGLALDFIRLAYESKAKWIIWENVPGVLSSNDGRDFQPFYQDLPEAELSLPKRVGETLDLFQMDEETDMEWHGEFWTLNIQEHPTFHTQCLKEDVVSSLSDILEIGDVPPKYYLSQKACLGILRRAERRGKELPKILKIALTVQADIANLQENHVSMPVKTTTSIESTMEQATLF